MGLDRAIASGKERRSPYRRSAVFDRTCRPHGSCPYCRAGRLFDWRRRSAERDLAAWRRGKD